MAHAPLLVTLAAAFTAAWILGVLAQRLHLSPIVGYLLAGIVIGPSTPGFVGDVALVNQLAEVGVALLMFGVGLHFHFDDLLAVRKIALPGALIQSLVATVLGTAIGVAFGWTWSAGLLLGIALSVASTIVLLRGLESQNLVSTPAGHVAIGWLIVEDILTVLVLVAIPALSAVGTAQATQPEHGLLASIALAFAKIAVLVALVLLAGSRAVPWLLLQVVRLRSRELFTLTILALAVAIGVGASILFGASMALGAFLAGMVVGQSSLSEQAAVEALPLRDAFAVLFFVSVGMLFEPSFLLREPLLLLAGLAVVLVGKPLAALAVVGLLGYSSRTGLVAALGLAQIGEFSFIVGDLARAYGLFSDSAYNLVIACAIISISLNPFLFRWLDRIESALRDRPFLWRLLNRASDRKRDEVNAETARAIGSGGEPLAVIVGYGPVGQAVDRVLREMGMRTVIVDMNMDTVAEISGQRRLALYGDATHPDILRQAGVSRASHLVITLPHSVNRAPMIAAARELAPHCRIIVRARYLQERESLEQVGADAACFEEVEAAVALTARVLRDLGVDENKIAKELLQVRSDTVGESLLS